MAKNITIRRLRQAWFRVNQQVLPLVADNTALACRRKVDWHGPGWYSLDDDKVYQKGERATISRIWIGFDYPGG